MSNSFFFLTNLTRTQLQHTSSGSDKITGWEDRSKEYLVGFIAGNKWIHYLKTSSVFSLNLQLL